jgi:hypothetical protein
MEKPRAVKLELVLHVGIVSDDFEFNQQIESAISMDAGLAFGPRLPYDNFLHIFLNIVQAN